jgi:hypothetical protein
MAYKKSNFTLSNNNTQVAPTQVRINLNDIKYINIEILNTNFPLFFFSRKQRQRDL